MRWRSIFICGTLLCILLVSSSLRAEAKMPRYHQHLMAEEKRPCTHDSALFCTHLPLVEIETDDQAIPGKAILEGNRKVGYTTAEDGSDRIEAHLKVIDNSGTNNHAADPPALESDIIIHVRGNSSRRFDKSSYKIKLVGPDGKSNPQSMMGMDAHHEWVLHGPFLDKTLLRNYMWYNIAGEIMDYAPNVRFCEVLLNGEYQGLYVMLESITAGENGARLPLSVEKKDNSYSGYLLCLDRAFAPSLQNANTFTKYAMRRKHDLEIVYPGAANLTPELSQAITQDFSAFEKALYSYDYDDPDYGYRNFIDVDSFADYFILNEFTCNYDAGWLSTYIYKDIDGKFKMCIWDFNSACDNYQAVQVPDDGFEFQNDLWYVMLLKDEAFNKRLISRYHTLREGVLSDAYLENYIDDVVAYLGDAIDRNYAVWGYTFGEEYDLLRPAQRNPRSYEDAIQNMKSFIVSRGARMDKDLETILQYSAPSKVKKFNENAN